MTEPRDDQLRQLMHELAEAAPASPAWEDLTGVPEPASPSRFTRRAPLLLAAAAALVLATVAAVVVVTRRDDSVTIGDEPSVPATASPTTTSPPTTGAPTSTPATAPPTIEPVVPAPSSAPSTPTTSAAPTTTSTTIPTPPTEPVASVQAYLADLTAGRYDDAAARLDPGPDWPERTDLAVLRLVSDADELAGALADWCAAGALCTEPVAVTAAESPDNKIVAEYSLDEFPPAGTFSIVPETGAVRGLPPLGTGAALHVLAAAGDADSIVTRLRDGTVVSWHDGELAELLPAEAFLWVEGDFVFWQDNVENDAGVPWPHTWATRFDGTEVCEVDGHMHRLREVNGRLVASVERPDELPASWDREVPVPNSAVDCASGERTPIDPITWMREGGSRGITRVADRTFTYEGDAEGNADVTNESGISINGDDYAGYHTYSPDGSRVVYADFTDAPGPHYTDRIRARDTTTGELLWTVEMPGMFASLHHSEDRVLVAYPPPTADPMSPWEATSWVDVHDAETGRLLLTVPTVIPIRDLH